jgi:ABC-2 type transport system permease protein
MQINPILSRELQTRSRRVGMTVAVTLFVLLMAGVAAIVWQVDRQGSLFGGSTNVSGAKFGRDIFEWVAFCQILLLCFLVPGTTAAAITGERDRQTLVPIQVTLLKPRHIVSGKMLASLAYTGLLLVTSLPIYALAYTLGGFTIVELVVCLAGIAAVALMLGAASIACSGLVRRTGPAVVFAYLVMLIFVVGTLVGAAIQAALARGSDGVWFARLNPIVIVGGMIRSVSDTDRFSGPMTGVGEVGYWWIGAILYALFTLAAFLLAVRQVRTPALKDR